MRSSAETSGRSNIVLIAVLVAIALVIASAGIVLTGNRADGGEHASSPVTVHAQLDDYSWQDLAAIAQDLSACSSEEQAVKLAAKFNLCGTDGTLLGQEKEIALADGTVAHATIAGFLHDDKTAGGKAGITFVLTDCMGTHSMNHAFEDPDGANADSVGGWGSSDMRNWVDQFAADNLPAELSGSVLEVQKATANRTTDEDEQNAGEITGGPSDWVSTTGDKFWLFSAAELCGDIPARPDLGLTQSVAAVYNAEGAQYQLFSQNGVQAFRKNEVLCRQMNGEAVAWWLRTRTMEYGHGFWLVGTDGTPLNGIGEDSRVVEDASYAPEQLWGPDHARGVVLGFCM